MSTLLLILETCVFIIIIYLVRYALRPCNRIRKLGDVGLSLGDPQLKGVYRERQINRLIKLRRLGELPPVYPNGWYCIAESDQVKPKSIKEVTVFGQFLTLLRSESGEVHLIDSYCPHLGANFNVGGKVVDNNCVQCPFHGWIFSAENGKCVRIPYDDGSIPEQAKVTVWPVLERNQHIYVWYHCDGNDPEWEIPEFDEITSNIWKYGGNNLLNIDLDNTKPFIRHVWNGKWTPKSGDEAHVSIMYLDQYMTIGSYKIPLTSTRLKAEQHGPGIVHMLFDFGILGRGVVLQHVTPQEPLLQLVRFKMFSTVPSWFSKFFLISEATQFERDIFIWSNKKFIKNPLVVRNDGPIQKHRRWYSQFYKENSPRLLPNGEISNQPRSIYDW
ncbi:rieske [2Fe-2S] domain protein [Dictyocaulus viviparus]|uniref:cholesterol 7-desaturase n=1 Tax=Dictyocaulus viviparus TaxID=29172 RepID=A0A0D8YCV9_DICVI|nr:rieske [2Fe-2S] domain protein [Dictyocaulus viviparus]